MGTPLWLKMDGPGRIVVAAVLLGFGLRLWGILWGLPSGDHLDSFHPDEWTVYSISSRIALTGDMNPHFFNYGSLPFLIGALVLKLTGAAGPVPSAYGYLMLRLVSVVAGCATIGLVAWVARSAFGDRRAMAWAALAAAVAPAAAQCAHFATVDVLAACLATASLGCALQLLERERIRWLILAGIFAGLSGAVKYVGLMAILPALACLCLARGSTRAFYSGRAALIPAAAFLAFALACPYAFLDSARFVRDFAFEARHIREGWTTELLGAPPLWYFVTQILPCGLSASMLLLAVASLPNALRGPRRGGTVVAGWLVLLTLAHGLGREQFVRYSVALWPMVAALVGAWALEPDRLGGTLRWVWRVAGAAALAWPLLISGATSRAMSRPDSRELAAEWLVMESHASGSLGMMTVPWFYTPPVLVQNLGPRARPEAYLGEAEQKGIELTITGTSVAMLELKRPEWFVTTEFETYWQERAGKPGYAEFREALAREYEQVARYGGDLDLGPLRLPRPRLHDWRYVSPEIVLYRRKADAP